MEGGQADALEQEIGGQRRALNFGVKRHHRNEEKQRREHRQRPGDRARDDGVAVAGQVPKDGQDHHRTDDVVAEIGEAVERPAGGLRMCRKSARHLRAETPQRQHNEDAVNRIEVVRDVAEKALHRLVAECDDARDPGRQDHCPDPFGNAQHGIADRSGGGAVDREDQHHEEQIAELEQGPRRAEQAPEEAAVIVASEAPRDDEGQRAENAEKKGRERIA